MKSPIASPVKVAIIGSGLAGLSAVYYLSKENQKRLQRGEGALFEVHLFEKVCPSVFAERRNFRPTTP